MTAMELFLYRGEDDDRQIRVLTHGSEPVIVAADLCAILDIGRTHDAVRSLDDDEKGTETIRTLGGDQDVTVVTESGMYSLILRSRKPEAKAFKRWITHEVIPAIRRHGSYSAPAALEGADLVAAGLVEATKMLAAKDEHITELTEKIADDAPKVNYVDLYVADSDLLRLRTVAANNNVGEQWLRDLLVAKDWVYVETESRFSERKGCKEIRRRYSAKAHKRSYFRPVEVHEAPRFKGEVMHTLKVTPTGAEAIARLVAKEAAA